MKNKKYITYMIAIFCVCFLLIGYFNYDVILKYFEGKEWEFAESFATIKTENISQVEAGKSLLLYSNNKLELFENGNKVDYSENLITTGLIVDSCEEYMTVVTKDTNNIYLFKGVELLWKTEFNWDILNASVNKNGYVAIIYSQSGYKSSIKIFKPTGEEMFTNYLASTYAIDVEISNDNKLLYIAEIDTDGIKIKSNIKTIDIANLGAGTNLNKNARTLEMGEDILITDIEYSSANKLMVLRDNGIGVIGVDNSLQDIAAFDVKNILFASINHLVEPIIIEKKATGIFANETILKILKEEEVLEVSLDRTPQSIDTMNNKIAINLGDEVLFFNMKGKLEKRYKLENQLLAVKLYNKGNMAALIFRNKIELIKL